MMDSLICSPDAVIKHHISAQLEEEKVYFILQLSVHHQWTPEQELKQKLFLACSPGLAQSAFLYSPGPAA